ncbi:MAG: IS110 family transposase [Candidatus Nanopelagicales bacterium]
MSPRNAQSRLGSVPAALLLPGQILLRLAEFTFGAAEELRRIDDRAVGKDRERCQPQIDSDLGVEFGQGLDACGTTLPTIQGVGTVTACRILARTGNPMRFPNEAAYANYTGTAPVEVASADKQRHRLSRSGDRALNSAIHIVAVTQARTPSSPGYEYHRHKLDEGKTSREAMRCLKRQIAKRLWRTMRADTEDRLRQPVAA